MRRLKFTKKKTDINKKRVLIIRLCIVLFVLLVTTSLVLKFIVFKPKPLIEINKLPNSVDTEYRAFGDKLLYVNDDTLYCINDSGKIQWKYQGLSGSKFDCNEDSVVLWQGSSINVLDAKGHPSYSDNLDSEILYAHVDKRFFAAVVGDERNSRLVIKDKKGITIDEEFQAFSNSLLLDFGFFGKNREFLWTLKLDTDSTAANYVINTFEVGKMNTGEISLGDYLTYKVLYNDTSLNIFNTRQLLSYDYRLSKETRQAILAYGWTLLDYSDLNSSKGKLLLASQDTPQGFIRDLRIITNNNDKRFTLPSNSVSACLIGNELYAISQNAIHKGAIDSIGFKSYEIDIPNGIQSYLLKLSNGKIVVSNGNELFVIKLP